MKLIVKFTLQIYNSYLKSTNNDYIISWYEETFICKLTVNKETFYSYLAHI